MRGICRSLFALAGALVVARAQTPAPMKIAGVTVTGSVRARLYFWDWFQPEAGENAYQYSGSILRLSFSQTRDTWDWNAEFAAPLLVGLPANATGTGPQQGALGLGANYSSANAGARNAAMIFPRQLYLRLNGFGASKRHTLQMGRFEFLDGGEVLPKSATLAAVKRDRVQQRLIGSFGFSDAMRSFDGVHYAYATPRGNFTFVGAVPTRGVFQVDGWGWNRTAFAYASYTRQWGGQAHAAETRLFFIEYDDFRHILKTDSRPLAARRADLANLRIDTFGGHTLHTVHTSAGTVDVLFWGALQTGRWGTQQHRAAALDIEAGLQPPARLRPWLRGGFTYGSGDADPADGTHGTFFQLLPTPRPYARFPFFNMMNTEDVYGILLLRPHPKVTLSAEFHALRLSNAGDLWYSGGGVFQPWTFGYTGRSTASRRSMGNLYDIGADYRVRRRLTLSGYAGYTQGLSAMEQIYPRGKDGRFGYLELIERF